MKVIDTNELEEMQDLIADLRTENDLLKTREADKINVETQKVTERMSKTLISTRKKAFDMGVRQGREEVRGSAQNMMIMKSKYVVVNGECEAFGRGNRIDRIFPINTDFDVIHWLVNPHTLDVTGVVAKKDSLFARVDGAVTQIRCYIGNAEIHPSQKKPVIDTDGNAKPIDGAGKVLETNERLQSEK